MLYLVNTKSKVVHKVVDGRIYEQCNTDQIQHKVLFNQVEFDEVEIRLVKCKRCFS